MAATVAPSCRPRPAREEPSAQGGPIKVLSNEDDVGTARIVPPGAILTGIFATRACWNIDGGNPLGLIEGGSKVFVGQIAAVAVTIVFSIVATLIILKVIDIAMGLRISPEGETRGLDITDHGEEGYIFF